MQGGPKRIKTYMSLKLSSKELRSVLIMGGGAMATGVLYQLLNVFVHQSTEVGIVLNPETERLQDHPALFNMFRQLDEYRDLFEFAYRDAVVYADKLAVLHHAVINENQPATRDRMIEAYTHHEMCKTSIEKLQRVATKQRKQTGEERFSEMAAKIHNLNSKVYPMTQQLAMKVHKKHRRA